MTCVHRLQQIESFRSADLTHDDAFRTHTKTVLDQVTHITEVLGLEGDVITTQDLFLYKITGEDANGKLIGQHTSTGLGRPKFWDRAKYYGEEVRLAAALDESNVNL